MSFRRVLIALDQSAAATRALDVGRELAQALGAEVACVHVVDPTLAAALEGGAPTITLLATLKQEGRHLLTTAAARLNSTPPPWQFLREGSPPQEIMAAAQEWGADLLVLGTRGRSRLARALWGSTAEAVVRQAPCPVVVVRPPQR